MLFKKRLFKKRLFKQKVNFFIKKVINNYSTYLILSYNLKFYKYKILLNYIYLRSKINKKVLTLNTNIVVNKHNIKELSYLQKRLPQDYLYKISRSAPKSKSLQSNIIKNTRFNLSLSQSANKTTQHNFLTSNWGWTINKIKNLYFLYRTKKPSSIVEVSTLNNLNLYQFKIINFFIKRGLKGKALKIWSLTLQILYKKVLALNLLDKKYVNTCFLSEIIIKAVDNVLPVVLLSSKKESEKLILDKKFNNSTLATKTTKLLVSERSLLKKKKIIWALSWILETVIPKSKKQLLYTKKNTIANKLADELYYTSINSPNSKSVEKKKELYWLLFNSPSSITGK